MIARWDYRLLGGYHLIIGLVGLGLSLQAYVPAFGSYSWWERFLICVIVAYCVALLRASYLIFHRVRRGWWLARRLQFLQIFQVALPGAAWILIVGPRTGFQVGGLEHGWLGFYTFVNRIALYLGSHDLPFTFGVNLVPVAILVALRETRDSEPVPNAPFAAVPGEEKLPSQGEGAV